MNKRYYRNHRLLLTVILRAYAKRQINLRTIDICRSAKLTTATFYGHFPNATVALITLEQELETEFLSELPKNPNRKNLFIYLLQFISRHHHYFYYALRSHDHYFLCRMLDHVRFHLIGDVVSKGTYIIYRGTIISHLEAWCALDRLSKKKIPFYYHKLMLIRLYTFES